MKLTEELKKYKLRFGLTLVLIIAEAAISLLFPLFIGYAIEDAINNSKVGAIQLGALGLSAVIVGGGRRIFDSRFYSKMYQDIGANMFLNLKDKSASVKTARLGMLRELIEFLENYLPQLIHSVIGLVGVVFIIVTLNLKVFYGSLLVTLIIFIIYWISSKKTVFLNKSYNNEIEKQVDIISGDDDKELKTHLKEIMKWNIKLSDLEAINFSVSWIVLISFLVVSITISTEDGTMKYGALFSLIMYVFQYIESVVNLPFFYQNWLRLLEIKERIENTQNNSNPS